MYFTSATDILLVTAKDLTADLLQSQLNPLLPPPNTQTRHTLVKLNEIFSNVTKPAESTHNNIPRISMITIKTLTDIPRVPPITTSGFIDMKATNRRILRQKNKAKNTQKNINNQKYQINQHQFLHNLLAQRLIPHHNLLLTLQTKDAASALLDQP